MGCFVVLAQLRPLAALNGVQAHLHLLLPCWHAPCEPTTMEMFRAPDKATDLANREYLQCGPTGEIGKLKQIQILV